MFIWEMRACKRTFCESNLYYKTDRHYTSDGAYSVYCLLGAALGYTP